MKKIISLILVLALCFLSVPAIAANDTSSSNTAYGDSLPARINVVSNGHGEYVSVADDQKLEKGKAVLSATLTEVHGVYLMADGSHVSYAGNDKYLAVDLLEVKPSTNVSALAAQYDVPKEIVRYVEKSQKHLIETNNTDAISGLVVPHKVMAKSTYTSEYYCQGYHMKDYWYYVLGDATAPAEVVSGINTKAIAEGLSQLAMIGVGVIPVVGAIFTNGISVLQAFYDMGNPYVTPTGTDFMYAMADLDHYTKWTSLDMGGYWAVGCVTQFARVTQANVIVHFTGQRTEISGQTMNLVQHSEDWDDPAPIAIIYANNPLTEYLEIQVAGITIAF